VGEWVVSPDDLVVGDADGLIFIPADKLAEVIEVAEGIQETELQQAKEMRAGRTFRTQTSFPRYLEERAKNPSLGFREYLRKIGGAIEE